ncbi:hypothetical protein Mgra_00009683, partial [Meloidogyne graminicola]
PTESSSQASNPTPILPDENEERKNVLINLFVLNGTRLALLQNRFYVLNTPHLPIVCTLFTNIFHQIFDARMGPLVLELGQVFQGIEWPENQVLTGRNILIEDYRNKYEILIIVLNRCLNVIEQTQLVDFNIHLFYNFIGFGTGN